MIKEKSLVEMIGEVPNSMIEDFIEVLNEWLNEIKGEEDNG